MTHNKTIHRNEQSKSDKRRLPLADILTSALPFIALAMPVQAWAATASNTATVTVPSGAIDPDTDNNIVTDSDNVLAALVSNDDTDTGEYGITGADAVINVFSNDLLNGATPTTANSVLSVATGSTVPTGLVFDIASGDVDVAAGTAAGTYTFDYTICEQANPTNCQDATVTVNVTAPVIAAVADSVGGIDGGAGANDVLNVLADDTLGANAASTGNVNITVDSGSSVPAGLTFNTSTGSISVDANSAAGVYSFIYQICDAINPANCDTATATVTVVAPTIAAVNDSATGINGATGQADVLNVLTDDMIGGVDATSGNVDITVATGSSVPTGLTFDVTSGSVSVDSSTPAGNYTFDYTICDELNASNCATATVSIDVEAPAIMAAADSISAIDGVAGASNVLNVLSGDTLNGDPATVSNVDITVATGSSVPTGLTFNTTTGSVSVDPNTPAGTYTFSYTICDKINPSNCATEAVSVTVAPTVDLSVTKSNGVTEVTSGDTITYTLVVGNAGPDAAIGAVISDAPGAGLTCSATQTLTITGDWVPGGSFTFGDLSGGGITLGTLNAGQSTTITYSCDID